MLSEYKKSVIYEFVTGKKEIPYGTALTQGMYELVQGYTIIGEDQPVVLETVNPIGTYAPGSESENAIIAKIKEGNTNYVLVEEDCTWGTLTVAAAGEEARAGGCPA